MTIFPTPNAQAHDLGIAPKGAVDSGQAIDYENNPIYNQKHDAAEWAISQWSALGRVVFRKDSISNVEDLGITSAYAPDQSQYYAWYSPTSGSDEIVFNLHTMQTISWDACKDKINEVDTIVPCADQIAMEEIGHALGLDHNGITDEPVCGQLHCGSIRIPPGGHDETDYKAKWGLPPVPRPTPGPIPPPLICEIDPTRGESGPATLLGSTIPGC